MSGLGCVLINKRDDDIETRFKGSTFSSADARFFNLDLSADPRAAMRECGVKCESEDRELCF